MICWCILLPLLKCNLIECADAFWCTKLYELWAICFAINLFMFMLVLKILNEFRKRQREKERMRIQTNQWERQCTWKACRPTENYVCVCVCVTKNTKANNLARERRSFMLSKYNFTLFDFDGTLDREREQVHAVNAIFFLLSLSSHLIASVLSALSATDCLCTVYRLYTFTVIVLWCFHCRLFSALIM